MAAAEPRYILTQVAASVHDLKLPLMSAMPSSGDAAFGEWLSAAQHGLREYDVSMPEVLALACGRGGVGKRDSRAGV